MKGKPWFVCMLFLALLWREIRVQTNFLEVDLQIPPTDIYTYLYVHAYMCIKYHVALCSRVFSGVRALKECLLVFRGRHQKQN